MSWSSTLSCPSPLLLTKRLAVTTPRGKEFNQHKVFVQNFGVEGLVSQRQNVTVTCQYSRDGGKRSSNSGPQEGFLDHDDDEGIEKVKEKAGKNLKRHRIFKGKHFCAGTLNAVISQLESGKCCLLSEFGGRPFFHPLMLTFHL
jgi:hypothetical protein